MNKNGPSGPHRRRLEENSTLQTYRPLPGPGQKVDERLEMNDELPPRHTSGVELGATGSSVPLSPVPPGPLPSRPAPYQPGLYFRLSP